MIIPLRRRGRRFQPITVHEPTQVETIEIRDGAKTGYERHHNVQIAPEAVRAAVRLSIRWLPDRRLPDKVFDLLDEACARARLPTINAPRETSGLVVTAETVMAVMAEWLEVPKELSEVQDESHNR